MLSVLRSGLLVLVASTWTSVGRSEAEPAGQPGYSARNEAETDEDFEFQGEYIGSALSAACCCETVGLQVIALGDGRFEAARLRGGLPGAGWDRCTRSRLSGERRDGVLTLADQDSTITIERGVALLRDASGWLRGQMRKTNRVSPTMGAWPPANAVTLFDGSTPENLQDARVTDDGLLMEGAVTRMPVGDFRLHLEFRTPYMPSARGQGRGNSGVYIQRRYEVQILDSFGLDGAANECGGLYKQQPPDLNLCLPPLAWQTFDIFFTAARWRCDGEKAAHARITLLHNGVAVHHRYALASKTGAGQEETPEELPIYFQNHGNPVRFRNLWIAPYAEAFRWCDDAGRRWRLRRPLLHRRDFRLFGR